MAELFQIISDPPPLAVDADGVVRVAGTRVTLDTIVAAYHDGSSAETIAEQYPVLEIGAIYSALGYYLRHRGEVDSYLDQRNAAAESNRLENDRRSPGSASNCWPVAKRHRDQPCLVVAQAGLWRSGNRLHFYPASPMVH